MGGDLTDRLRGGALAALAVVVVAVVVGWWRAEAPTTAPPGGPSGASAVVTRAPSDGPGVASRGPAAEASPGAGRRFGASRGRASWTVDARTGRVIARLRAGVGATRDESSGGWSVQPSRTLWRAQLTLRPGLPPQRRVLTPAGARPHLLEFRCAGQGQLLLVSVHSGRTESRHAPCDGTAATMLLNGGDGPLRIEFAAAPGGGPAVVDAHLATVPF